MFKMILASDEGDGIGRDGRLAWHSESDMKHFVQMTKGQTMLCGIKTWDTLPFRLRGEKMIVLSHDRLVPCWHNAHSVDEVLKLYHAYYHDIYVIGGASVYSQFMPWVKEIIWTRIPGIADCDRRYRPNTARFTKVRQWDLDGPVFMKDAGRTPETFKPRKVEGNPVVEIWKCLG